MRVTYSSKVTRVDAESATVHFVDGSSQQGDLLVGADGVGSVTRRQVHPSMHAKPGRHSAFRFLVKETDALADPRSKDFFSVKNTEDMWYAEKRKVVMYRCENNDLLNFVCIHPAELSSATADSWHTAVDKKVLLNIFEGFHVGVLAMLEKADPESLRVYPLFDMDTLPTFTTGKLALIGDAAHPFLPHLAQGGAQAMEDGVSLGVMMSNISRLEEIPPRLQLYNEARYGRATRIQEYTRRVGGDGVKNEESSGDQLACKWVSASCLQ